MKRICQERAPNISKRGFVHRMINREVLDRLQNFANKFAFNYESGHSRGELYNVSTSSKSIVFNFVKR